MHEEDTENLVALHLTFFSYVQQPRWGWSPNPPTPPSGRLRETICLKWGNDAVCCFGHTRMGKIDTPAHYFFHLWTILHKWGMIVVDHGCLVKKSQWPDIYQIWSTHIKQNDYNLAQNYYPGELHKSFITKTTYKIDKLGPLVCIVEPTDIDLCIHPAVYATAYHICPTLLH